MAAYNAESTILRAINSVLAQTHENVELIVIDNNSNDKTQAIIDSCLDKRIVSLQCTTQGACHARNVGLDIASGEYVCFLDADDYLLKNSILTRVEFLAASEAKAVCSSYLVKKKSRLKLRRVPINDINLNDLRVMNLVPFCTALFERKHFHNLRFKSQPHEDYIFWIETCKIAPIATIQEITAVYDADVSGISANKLKSAYWHYLVLRHQFSYSMISSVVRTAVRSAKLLV
ncbi:glycosyltransferase family A protein [Roseivivax sp. THAF197b]|uniref:glycosyltransferase family 2 protein n=1 Tax=Roseivivax sp. THAF197b TaxID=2588299 RepID=UPI001268242A